MLWQEWFIQRLRHYRQRSADQRGQALVETVMATGFLVALAIFINKTLGPIVLEAFENIAQALARIGP